MSQTNKVCLVLTFDLFADSKLEKEFNKETKKNPCSLSKFISKKWNCECAFLDNDNQESEEDDTWHITFPSRTEADAFIAAYGFSNIAELK